MAKNLWAYRGCLLGMAVGDAMGYTVDSKSMSQIREDYGPNGLLGYDLMNGFAEITSYTQLAAFTCNGLLLGITRGQMQGHMAPLVRYVEHAQREWAASQRPWTPGCWIPSAAVLWAHWRRESIPSIPLPPLPLLWVLACFMTRKPWTCRKHAAWGRRPWH